MRTPDDAKKPSEPPLVGPLLRVVRRPENRIVILAAAVIILGGACVFLAVFAARGQVSSWLSVVGGTLFAAGTSVFLSVLAARQSAMEGYAKEANVEHKDKLYMPLYDELKQLADELKEARVTLARPYPQVIDDGRRSRFDSHVGIFVTFGYTRLTLSLWSTIRTTRQVEYFSVEARRLLDATLEHADLQRRCPGAAPAREGITGGSAQGGHRGRGKPAGVSGLVSRGAGAV